MGVSRIQVPGYDCGLVMVRKSAHVVHISSILVDAWQFFTEQINDLKIVDSEGGQIRFILS